MQLTDLITSHFRLGDIERKALDRLELKTIRDLLFYFPSRYGNISEIKLIRDITVGETVTLYGKISGLKAKKAWRSKRPMGEGILEDSSGTVKIMWFNQAYMAKMVHDGQMVELTGRVATGSHGLYITNPELKSKSSLPIDTHDSLFTKGDAKNTFGFPVYPETRGLTSKWLYHCMQKIFASGVTAHIDEYLPEELLKKYKLPKLGTALIWVHAPQNENNAKAARKRFAFEEVFFIQLQRAMERASYEENNSYAVTSSKDDIADFVGRFPFTMTKSQEHAIDAILENMTAPHPMARLLEGDVGSGKTAVAATSAYAVIKNRPPKKFPEALPRGTPLGKTSGNLQTYGSLQIAYMAPTEILATQHFENFIKYFKHTGISIGLITGSGCRKFPTKVASAREPWTNISRAQLLKWVENGEIPILIGTHALIQKSVKFRDLALVIVDEQHRFGVSQRLALARGKTRNERGTNAEKETIEPLLYRDLTYRIRNALFNVKKELGGGHKEIIYQKAVAIEFEKLKLQYSSEVQIPITYKKKKVGTYVPDFVVEGKIIVELKALPFLGATEKKQLWGYLKGSSYSLGLLANFGPKELEIQRVVYELSRSSSASVPHSSASDPRQKAPHFLSMTATPIPRTLALTIYGDLDLTLLDEMPHGRKPVITEVVLPNKREETYEKIRSEMRAGRQLYVICPRINEPDPEKELAVQAKSVTEEAKRLKKNVFPEYEIGVLHSKMTKQKKEEMMEKFSKKEINILLATSVVEVGVNVPNATVIIIEGAERFGLAQLHQLRGRVIRSNHQAYCYLFAESKSEKTAERLKALRTAKNGFELAELDLALRGAGELAGTKQWGITDLGMEAIKNIKMVEAARTEAHNLVQKDAQLIQAPNLRTELSSRKLENMHFE